MLWAVGTSERFIAYQPHPVSLMHPTLPYLGSQGNTPEMQSYGCGVEMLGRLKTAPGVEILPYPNCEASHRRISAT